MLLSVPAYATKHGVSKVAAYKWKARGWLVLDGNMVNVAESDARLAQYRDPGDARADRKPRADPPKRAAAAPTPPPDDALWGADLAAGNASTEEARRVKENYLALKGRLEYQQAAGKLVDVEVAESVFFEEARAVRNAWLNFPAKYAALIAADLDIEADKVTTVLTGYIHRQVNSLGDQKIDLIKR